MRKKLSNQPDLIQIGRMKNNLFLSYISPENLDTIKKNYRIFNLTIFEYNIFEKVSTSKIWIQYS